MVDGQEWKLLSQEQRQGVLRRMVREDLFPEIADKCFYLPEYRSYHVRSIL